MSKTSNSSSGLGFGTVLFLIFLVLKLTKSIDWSWWWVTCPLWVGVVIWLFFSLIAFSIWLYREVTR